MDKGAWRATVSGVAKKNGHLSDSFTFHIYVCEREMIYGITSFQMTNWLFE